MNDFFTQHKLKFLSGLGVAGIGSTAASCVALNGSPFTPEVETRNVQPETVQDQPQEEVRVKRDLQQEPLSENSVEVLPEVQIPENAIPPLQKPVAKEVKDEQLQVQQEKPVTKPDSVEVKAPKETKPTPPKQVPSESTSQRQTPVENKQSSPTLPKAVEEPVMPPPQKIIPTIRRIDPEMMAIVNRLAQVPPRRAQLTPKRGPYSRISSGVGDWLTVDLGWGSVKFDYPVNSMVAMLENRDYLISEQAEEPVWRSRAIEAWNQMYSLTDDDLNVYDDAFRSFFWTMRANWDNYERHLNSWGNRLKGLCTGSYYRKNASRETWNSVYDWCRIPNAPVARQHRQK